MNLLPNLPRLSTVVNMMMNASSDGHMYEYLVNPISLIIILLVTEASLPSLDLAFGYRAQSHFSVAQIIFAALLSTSQVECVSKIAEVALSHTSHGITSCLSHSLRRRSPRRENS